MEAKKRDLRYFIFYTDILDETEDMPAEERLHFIISYGKYYSYGIEPDFTDFPQNKRLFEHYRRYIDKSIEDGKELSKVRAEAGKKSAQMKAAYSTKIANSTKSTNATNQTEIAKSTNATNPTYNNKNNSNNNNKTNNNKEEKEETAAVDLKTYNEKIELELLEKIPSSQTKNGQEIMMKYGFSENEYVEIIEEFKQNCRIENTVHENEHKLIKHFNNFCRKKYDIKEKEKIVQKEKENGKYRQKTGFDNTDYSKIDYASEATVF